MDSFHPAGYYVASAGGEELIGWQVNRGDDQAPDFFPVRSSAPASTVPTSSPACSTRSTSTRPLADANKAAGAPVAKAVPVTAAASDASRGDQRPGGGQRADQPGAVAVSYVARMATSGPDRAGRSADR